mmetsp:Transcript_5000/g.14699  ORF Transcript_5000/g.14699 Transcript_5000/m.14699 type:complete len:82 (+) Transcript_5000:386-631(+)
MGMRWMRSWAACAILSRRRVRGKRLPEVALAPRSSAESQVSFFTGSFMCFGGSSRISAPRGDQSIASPPRGCDRMRALHFF